MLRTLSLSRALRAMPPSSSSRAVVAVTSPLMSTSSSSSSSSSTSPFSSASVRHFSAAAAAAAPSSSAATNGKYGGKVVIVTGGSRGIGEGIVRVFNSNGAKVVFCGLAIHSGPGLSLEKQLNAARPGTATFVECDITDQKSMDNLVATTLAKYGRIDCLVNNAGWHPHAKPIDEFSLDDARYLINLNLLSAWYLCKLTVPHLRKTRGNIINISSLSGFFGQAGSSTYCATKGGLTAMTKSIAIDEAAHDVRANTVSPGNVWTPLWEEHVSGPTAEADMQAGKDAQLLGRMGTIEEVGEVCLHLATAEYTTGHEYLMTGGAELGYSRKTRKDISTNFG